MIHRSYTNYRNCGEAIDFETLDRDAGTGRLYPPCIGRRFHGRAMLAEASPMQLR